MNILCVFCEHSLDDGQEVVTLGVKGCEGIARASQAQGSSLTTLPGQRVHSKCCHGHCNKRRIEQNLKRLQDDDTVPVVQVSLQSSERTFNFKDNCLFCGILIHLTVNIVEVTN